MNINGLPFAPFTRAAKTVNLLIRSDNLRGSSLVKSGRCNLTFAAAATTAGELVVVRAAGEDFKLM